MSPKLLKGTHLYYVAAAKEKHTPNTLKPWKGRKSQGQSLYHTFHAKKSTERHDIIWAYEASHTPWKGRFPMFLGKPSNVLSYDIIVMVWVTHDKLLRQTVVPLVAFLLDDLLTELWLSSIMLFEHVRGRKISYPVFTSHSSFGENFNRWR